MAHNGYFYPDDIIIEMIDGKRVARIGLELPTIWVDEAKNASEKVDFITGWEMAREAYRKNKIDIWYKATYPKHWEEGQAFKLHMSQSKSVALYSQALLEARK